MQASAAQASSTWVGEDGRFATVSLTSTARADLGECG
jgi:glycine cleavage system H lipoate-binding protein